MEKSLNFSEFIDESDDILDVDWLLEETDAGRVTKEETELLELDFGEADAIAPVAEKENIVPKTEKEIKYIIKNGKKLAKTKTRYVYKIYGGAGFVYRLYSKSRKIDKWVMTNPDSDSVKKKPFSTEAEAEQHMLVARYNLRTINSDEIRQNNFVRLLKLSERRNSDL